MAAGQGPDGHDTTAGDAPDRPWLAHPPQQLDPDLVRQWRQAADRGYTAARRSLTGAASAPTGGDLDPGITVVVPSYRGRDHIERCLRSLAAQTLERSLFEVIVVLNGPADGTREIIDLIRKDSPGFDLRVVSLDAAGASRARNAGIAAARRRYTTFVDDDDHVSAAFLEVLLAHAGPHTVAVAPVVDIGPGRESRDNYINERQAPHLDRRTLATEVTVATSFNAAKAVATDLVRDIPYDPDLASGEDVLFWTTVVVRGHVDFLPCPPAAGATYYRVLRGGSASRREPGFEPAVTVPLDLISRLDGLLDEAAGPGAALVRDRMEQVTVLLNSYLREQPDQHPGVVAEIDRRPIFDLPYERLNHGLGRGLVVAYAFPPYADTSAVVTAKRLRARGEVADVVSNAMDPIRGTDPSIDRISGPFVARRARLGTPSAFEAWGAMEAFALEGLRTIQEWEEEQERRYEWLYSRAQFAASHLLAAAYKLANPQVRWVAEFSDPLSRDVLGDGRGDRVDEGDLSGLLRRGMRRRGLALPRSRNGFVWAEELAYALADELVFTNEYQRDYMLSYCSRADLAQRARQQAVISPHPTLPDAFYSMVRSEYPLHEGFVHIGYFGNFYTNRGADGLLASLAATDPPTLAAVRVHFFTARPDEVAREAAERGLSDCVRAGPQLRYLEFLNLTTRLDALVVADAATAGRHQYNPYLPSKWSDYRGSGTPVWGMVEDGSALSRQPLDLMSPVGDPAAGAEVIAELVRRTDRRPATPGARVPQPRRQASTRGTAARR